MDMNGVEYSRKERIWIKCRGISQKRTNMDNMQLNILEENEYGQNGIEYPRRERIWIKWN